MQKMFYKNYTIKYEYKKDRKVLMYDIFDFKKDLCIKCVDDIEDNIEMITN